MRLGAARVDMACLESREKMPAHPDEVKEGEEAGIHLARRPAPYLVGAATQIRNELFSTGKSFREG